jgi:hypothetical protein
MTGLHTVHVRVNDAATGRPTPVRIRLTDAAGNYYPPLGRLSQFATGRGQDVGGNLLLDGKEYAYIDGTCEVPLPAGTIIAELWKGPEYRPQTIETQLAAGKLALRLAVERWVNLREQGWYSGDTRCHYLSPRAALLEAAAEDLAVVNVLALEDRIKDETGKAAPAIPNILDFSGQMPAAEMPGHLVAVNTRNTHPVLGSLGLLNTHRVVYPLTFGGPAGADDWTLADWCDQCHRKGGLVVRTLAPDEDRGYPIAEPLAELILGKVDAYEISSLPACPFLDGLSGWLQLLGCGSRVPLVGASGKHGNDVPLGAARTYARLQPGEQLTYRAWIEAVRAGRTFVTNGPLVSLTVNGQDPGAVIDLEPSGGTLQVRTEARSILPFSHLELVSGGVVTHTATPSGEPQAAVIEAELSWCGSGWLAACCRGTRPLERGPTPQHIFAHTSPVYIRVEGREAVGQRGRSLHLIGHIDRMLQWVAREARCPTEKHRAALADVFTAARNELLRRAV